MDVESVKSTNSYRSHSHNNSNNGNKVYTNNYDPNAGYMLNNSAVTGNVMNTYPVQNMLPNNYNPGYYQPAPSSIPQQPQQQPPITNNYIYPVPAPTNNYVPVSILQNSGYGTDPNMAPSQYNGEKIQVQILPQDDNWGGAETCTAITSDTGGSCDDMMMISGMGGMRVSGADGNGAIPSRCECSRVLGSCIFVLLCVVGVFSPVAMVVAPQLPMIGWQTAFCGTACEGLLLGMACKLIVLAGGSWALFFRPRRQFSGPRICIWRVGVVVLASVVVVVYWLLFCLRVLRQPQSADFLAVVQFASSLTDSLLLIHYLALIVLEIRRLKTRFYVRVTRSPDGETRLYELGLISLQQAAIQVLQKYVGEFPEYNYELAQCLQKRCSKRHSKQHGCNDKPRYKVYNVDNNGENVLLDKDPQINESSTGSGHKNSPSNSSGTSARIYEETEWEKKFRKRQMRLLVAVEEALSHVRPTDEATNTLGPLEAAQTLLPAVMKPLQKLLRASRRQLAFSSTTVSELLSQCLSYRLSARFLVKQLSPNLTVLDSIRLSNPEQEPTGNIQLEWMVISNCLLSRTIFDGLVFQLKPQNCKIENLSLLCTIQSVPFFSIQEQKFDPNRCRFILQTNSETSV